MIKRIVIPSLLSVLLTAVCAAQNVAGEAARVPAAAPERTPTSEIEAITPPWETGPVQWPMPNQIQPPQEWLPELEKPWIGEIERHLYLAAAQTQAYAVAAMPAQSLPAAYVLGSAPPTAWREPSANMVKVVPRMPAEDNTVYWVQVGAYNARQHAQEAYNRLTNAGFSPLIEVHGELFRVLIPGVRGNEIRAIGEQLYNAGFREVWIREGR